MLKTLATATLIFAAATAAHGQTFSKTTIDTSGLEYFAMPGHGGVLIRISSTLTHVNLQPRF